MVVGDGGTGKSQLAAAAHRNPAAAGAQLPVWATAASRDGVVATYARAWELTRPGGDPLTGHPEDQAEAFLAWLGALDRDWLVVLDDVHDPTHLHDLYPQGPTGKY